MSPVAFVPAATPVPGHVVPLASTVVVSRANPAPYGWQVRVVRSGDTLSAIAIVQHTTVAGLVAKNRLPNGGHSLQVGQRLWVPRTTKAPPATPAVPVARYTTYTIRSGDTIGSVALRYHVSEATVLSVNRLSRAAWIHPGQKLRIPAGAARVAAKAAAPAVTYASYTVRSGDTVGAIALRLRVSEASILKANQLVARSIIQIGQKLRVPSGSSAKPAFSQDTFAGRTYASSIVSAAAANRSYLARRSVPSRSQTQAMIVATARRHGVDPGLALAIAWQESGWNQRQVSVANAIGTMQVIPSSGVWASQLSGRRLNLLDTQDNITAGVVILRSLTRSATTQEQAIAGYYQGLYSVQHDGMYPDTKTYVKAILALKARM